MRLKRNTSNQSEKYYSDIREIPLYNWDECQNGNVRWVNYDGISTKKDFDRFEILQDQYIDRYDLKQEMIDFLNIKILLTKLRLAYVETGDRMLLNQIEIETSNLEKSNPDKIDGMTIDQALSWLRTQMPTWIDKRVITIVDFRDLLDEYGRRSKQE